MDAQPAPPHGTTPRADRAPGRHVAKRQFYFTCGPATLDWQDSWFTEPFFSVAQTAYESAALHGPINPPASVLATIPGCDIPTTTPDMIITTSVSPSQAADTLTTASLVSSSPTTPTSTNAVPAASAAQAPSATGTLATQNSSQSTTTVSSPYPTAQTSPPPNSLLPPSGVPATGTDVSTSHVSSPSATVDAAGFANSDAGTWDAQAQGTAVTAGIALAAGVLVWVLWAVLRPRIRTLYAPRSWFLPRAARPTTPTLLAFLTPFLHLPSLASPASDTQVMAHVGVAVLAITALGFVVAVPVLLPLMVAGVPHLRVTAPQNTLGGRLGSLTDLSLLRLLNALDPSTEAPAASQTPRTFAARALPTTISPAIGSARARLIAILVVVAVLWVGGSIFVIARTYAKLSGYAKRFDDVCMSQEMVFVPADKAVAWHGLTETGIRNRLRVGPDDEGSVVGVFAIGHRGAVRELVNERAHVLDVLERAEAQYIASFPPLRSDVTDEKFTIVPAPSPSPVPPTSPLSPASPTSPLLQVSHSTSQLDPHSASQRGSQGETLLRAGHSASSSLSATSAGLGPGGATDFAPAGAHGSAFLEVRQRESVIFRSGGPVHIGQRVVQDEDGTFLPSPSDDGRSIVRYSYLTGSSAPMDHRYSLPASSEAHYSSVGGSRPTSLLLPKGITRLKADIAWSKARLLKLNHQVEAAQQKALNNIVKGDSIIGWIIVGRGVRSLPFAQDISGRSKEDIQWDNLGLPSQERKFWTKVIAVIVTLAAFSFPFTALAVAGAPGFAHHVGALGWLRTHNGVGAGLTMGLAPSLILIMFLVAGMAAAEQLAHKVNSVSYSHQNMLALKAAFYILFVVGTLWFVTAGALLFAIQAFTAGVQESRAVGDGAIYITWLPFLMLISLAIVVPGVMLLRPLHLLLWFFKKRKAITPRQKFLLSRPPNYNPTAALAPTLAAMFYASAMASVFPLIAIPALLFTYLLIVAHCWLTKHVLCVTRGGMSDGTMAMWIVRRVGWAVSLQPVVFGLALLSRREWIIGGVGLGVSLLALLVSEALTVGLHRRPMVTCFSRTDLSSPASEDYDPFMAQGRRRLESDRSILETLHTLLPGMNRLPADNPLPLPTDAIDDLRFTERASKANPRLVDDPEARGIDDEVVFIGAMDESRGLIYPPELLEQAPHVWLPRDKHGLAQREADNLAGEGLAVWLNPVELSE